MFILYDRPTIDQQIDRERLDIMRESVRLQEQKLNAAANGAEAVQWIIHMEGDEET